MGKEGFTAGSRYISPPPRVHCSAHIIHKSREISLRLIGLSSFMNIYLSNTCKHVDVFSLVHGYYALTFDVCRVLGVALLGGLRETAERSRDWFVPVLRRVALGYRRAAKKKCPGGFP